jgi:antitoxin component YwqK of YwqJK toxin-antitoxin module
MRPIKDLFSKDDNATGTDILYHDENRMHPFSGIVFDLYPDGKLMWEAEIKDGRQNGIEKHYFRNGNVEQINEMKDNTICGISKEYHECGNLCSESIVIRNVFIKSIFYDKVGNIIRRENTPYGKMQEAIQKQLPDYMSLRIGQGEGIIL